MGRRRCACGNGMRRRRAWEEGRGIVGRTRRMPRAMKVSRRWRPNEESQQKVKINRRWRPNEESQQKVEAEESQQRRWSIRWYWRSETSDVGFGERLRWGASRLGRSYSHEASHAPSPLRRHLLRRPSGGACLASVRLDLGLWQFLYHIGENTRLRTATSGASRRSRIGCSARPETLCR